MTRTRFMQTSLVALVAGLALASPAQAADVLLGGTITSAAGEKLGGVTISAKPVGSTIATTVFTDANGEYYFPPLPAGKYRVWAQAVRFTTAKNELDLGADKRQNITLQPLADFYSQLSGDQVIAALPDATPDDQRMKNIIRNNCTGCHTPSYPLQHKFDEAGWTAMLDLMKHVNVLGVYQGPDHKANEVIDSHEKELASYLARARGPGQTSMTFDHLRPRPSGESARVVFKEYDVPLDLDEAPPHTFMINDGSDWMKGTPSDIGGGHGVHDAQMDEDGNIWWTHNTPTKYTTVGRIDGKTGEVRSIKIAGLDGNAANSHGIIRDPQGIIWFNVGPTVVPRKGGLARLDPKTEKVEIFVPSGTMSGAAGSLDYDGKGKIWVTSADGALRFDPDTKEFTEFKSVNYKTANGLGTTYGIAADKDGNGFWAEMSINTVVKGDFPSKESIEVKLAPVESRKAGVTPEEMKVYDKLNPTDFNMTWPWAQGPRRMGADKVDNVIWVGDSWGGNYARINPKTLETTYVPLPNPVTQQPYHITVDSKHGAWTNLWTADQIIKLDPKTNQWTTYDLPTLGTESRYISLLEQDGKMQVVVPYSRARKVAVMSFRSEADIAARKAQLH
jgi:streptogramin lyase